MPIMIPVAIGELLDKMTILEIKRSKAAEPQNRALVEAELKSLEATARDLEGLDSTRVVELRRTLKDTNMRLWDIEDAIREKESNNEFDSGFIELARSVYHLNDKRALIKKSLNEVLGSEIQEVKLYASYEESDGLSGETQ